MKAQAIAELETTVALKELAQNLGHRSTQEAQAALQTILDGLQQGFAAGELDLATTLMLQQQALAGAEAAVAQRLTAAQAWLAWQLALEDPSLLGGP